MGPNNVVGAPNVQQSQPTVPVSNNAVEQALASLPTEPTSANQPMEMKQKKSGKGMLYGMIFFAILAIAGISFGVWAMMDGNNKVANLEKQVSELRLQNSKLLEQLVENEDSSNEEGGSPNVNPEEYIYVGEWGIKIKVPENWREIIGKYIYSNNYPQGMDGLEVRGRNDAPGNGVNISQLDESIKDCSTVSVVDNEKICLVLSEKVYTVSELVGELTLGSESTLSSELRSIFMNPDNYSKI